MSRPPSATRRRPPNPKAAPGANEGAKRRNIARVVQGLRRIVKALHSYSREVQTSYGLTGPQLWALRTLEGSGPTTIGQLAESLAVHPSSASLLLDRLERRGLLRRVRGTADRRQVTLELTTKGQKLVAGAPEAAQGRLLHGLEGMTVREVEEVRRSVDRMVHAMEVADVKARFFFSDD